MDLAIFNRNHVNDFASRERAQARADAIVAAAKASAAVPPKRSIYRAPDVTPLEPSRDALEARIQEELVMVGRTLEMLGEELANDPILLTRYQTSLQSIDIMSQTLTHLARVVGSADKAEAVDRIGMANLKARLARGTESIAEGPARLTLHRTDSNPF